MKDVTYLEYCFIIEDGTYMHVDMVDKDLADFLAANGVEAVLANTSGAYPGKRVFFLRKLQIQDAPNAAIAAKMPIKKNKGARAQFDKYRK